MDDAYRTGQHLYILMLVYNETKMLNIDVDIDTDIVDSGRLTTCAGQTPERGGRRRPPFYSVFWEGQIIRAGAWQV